MAAILHRHVRRLEAGLPQHRTLLYLPDLAQRLQHGRPKRRHAQRIPTHFAPPLFQHARHVHPRRRQQIQRARTLPLRLGRLRGTRQTHEPARRTGQLRTRCQKDPQRPEPQTRVFHRPRQEPDHPRVRPTDGLERRLQDMARTRPRACPHQHRQSRRQPHQPQIVSPGNRR